MFQVDGYNVLEITHEEAVAILKSTTEVVHLQILRAPLGTQSTYVQPPIMHSQPPLRTMQTMQPVAHMQPPVSYDDQIPHEQMQSHHQQQYERKKVQ